MLVESNPLQLKFVVTDRDDVEQATELVNRVRDVTAVRVYDSDVLLMPEGTTRD